MAQQEGLVLPQTGDQHTAWGWHKGRQPRYLAIPVVERVMHVISRPLAVHNDQGLSQGGNLFATGWGGAERLSRSISVPG